MSAWIVLFKAKVAVNETDHLQKNLKKIRFFFRKASFFDFF